MAKGADFSLAGRTAIVTGAASGIGAAIAEAFAAASSPLMNLSKSRDNWRMR